MRAATQAARVTPTHFGASSLVEWLLDIPQLRAGPEVGGVAGLIGEAGTPTYVYPEIAGYYLSWLAFRAARDGADDELAARAGATQRWLARWSMHETPLTRVHLTEGRDDWRNGALFCFDLALVLRGLGSAEAQGLIAPDPGLLRRLGALLGKCVAGDGAFDAVAPFDRSRLPSRWSTRRGAFLAKAATGVLRASARFDLDPMLRTAAEQTYAQSVAALKSSPHLEVHPLLYACEGVLDLPRHPAFEDALPHVSARLQDVLASVNADGYLPERLGSHDETPSRIDVIAQALRVGHLLALHGRPPRDPQPMARLAGTLWRELQPDGGVRFSRESPLAERNVWAAMFADQALAYAMPVSTQRGTWCSDPLLV